MKPSRTLTSVLSIGIALASLIIPNTARAVVIDSGTGSGNTSAPGDDFGFGNIGSVGGASGIYLGNRWVLTAYHVAGSLPASATFGGSAYATEGGTHQRLTNNGEVGMTANTDMVVFRLASDPGLPWLTINSSVTTGDALSMAGRGRDRQSSATNWDVDTVPDPDSWTEVPPTGDRTGYKTDATQTIRWGENLAASTGLDVASANGDVRSFSTTFTDGGLTHEAQAVVGDSGGGVFHKNGDNWELAGMMYGVDLHDGQPNGAETAVYGNETYSAELSFYRTQIIGITGIPEPTSAALGFLSLALFLRRRR
ncbi:trypsin-like peptidase domain-containing protein [Haloferula sp.]|uniref:trypsin-like peptidase domain-containing protein n=1 Tax=Haloferula sp. TaxID=2497595 RepID=UPI00329DBFDF